MRLSSRHETIRRWRRSPSHGDRAGAQAARREATRLDAIIGERSSLIESNYADATQERLSELEAAVTAAREYHGKVEQTRKEAKTVAEAASDAERNIGALTQSISQLESALTDLKRLAEDWPPLAAQDHSTQEELERTQKLLDETQDAGTSLERRSRRRPSGPAMRRNWRASRKRAPLAHASKPNSRSSTGSSSKLARQPISWHRR